MIKVYPAESRYSFDHGWIRGNYSFSFGDYNDPENTAFGPMRVCNDDTLAPGRGFGAHPHSDMEIVSIVLKGRLRHEDNLGNVAVTSFGEIQRMSAGSGVVHTEHNVSDRELNLLQMWFMPAERGIEPSYETTRFDPDSLNGRLLPVVSNGNSGQGRIAHIHQDMTICLSRLESGEKLDFEQEGGRRIFLFVLEGGLAVNGETRLSTRDSARISGVTRLELAADGAVLFMLIDLP